MAYRWEINKNEDRVSKTLFLFYPIWKCTESGMTLIFILNALTIYVKIIWKWRHLIVEYKFVNPPSGRLTIPVLHFHWFVLPASTIKFGSSHKVIHLFRIAVKIGVYNKKYDCKIWFKNSKIATRTQFLVEQKPVWCVKTTTIQNFVWKSKPIERFEINGWPVLWYWNINFSMSKSNSFYEYFVLKDIHRFFGHSVVS